MSKPLTWWFDDITLSMCAEGALGAGRDHLTGWVAAEDIDASVEDLQELAARGMIETVAEGPTRLYRLAAGTGPAATRVVRD